MGALLERRRTPAALEPLLARPARALDQLTGDARDLLGGHARAALAADPRAARRRPHASRGPPHRRRAELAVRRPPRGRPAGPGDALQIDTVYSETVALRGQGLLLVPSAFIWRPFAITSPPWQPTLIYPARGVALLWERGDPAPDALAAVLGRARAELLAALAAPASTTELAGRLGRSAGGISEHLTALRDAGLVSAARQGRSVLYVRTPVADRLVTR